MSRIEFNGLGTLIPTIALPPFGSDDNLPPTTFTFLDNAIFEVEQYRTLGFTHFEAWCVGAAGGKGGDATNQPFFVYEEIWRPVPLDVWNVWLSQFDNTTIYYGWDPGDPTRGGTQRDMQEFNNPNHMLKFRTYKQVLLYPTTTAIGGGGGGGGMQKVSGLLADLDDSVSIVVGKAGLDAPLGQIHQNGLWTPQYTDDFGYSYSNPFITDYLNSYPGPKNSYLPPQVGADGGASMFADDVGQASGGKGGSPGMIWNGSAFVLKGDGGAGGIGGRSLAGGGGAGSVAEGINGSDGIWHPETGIGAGGGGGKGGRGAEQVGDPRFGVPTIINHLATAGGQGSYSFADTSVYGPRQFRQARVWQKPVVGYSSIPEPGHTPRVGNWPNGTVTYTTATDLYLSVPGGGGGARPAKNLKVGSRAPGFSPDGAVVLRLSRIV